MLTEVQHLKADNSKTRYFPALTGVRAIAAWLVFAGHCKLGVTLFPAFLSHLLINAGHLSLAAFFVLSSFVINIRYSHNFSLQQISFRDYYVRRFARIYPLFYIITIILLIWQKDFSIQSWFLNLTFLKSFFNDAKFTGISQAWSLTVEECFYLTAPLLFIYFQKHALKVLIALLGSGFALVFISQKLKLGSFMNSADFMLEFTFLGRCFEFYCGYRLFTYFRNKQVTAKKNNYAYTFSGIVLIVACLVLFTWLKEIHLVVFNQVSVSILVNNFILPLAIIILYYGLLIEKNWITKFLSSKFMQQAGRNSYAFALLHAGLFYEFIYFHISQHKVLIFIVLNCLAFLVHKAIEKPIDNYLQQVLKRKELAEKTVN